MVDIDSLMELFDEMEESEIEKLCLTMNTKAGANFSLIITRLQEEFLFILSL